MKKLTSENGKKRVVDSISTRKRISNIYGSPDRLLTKIMCEQADVYEYNETILIVEKFDSYNTLYYLSDTWEWIKATKELNNLYNKIIIGIVQKDVNLPTTLFDEVGINKYKIYRRMKRGSLEMDDSDTVSIERCNLDDIYGISDMISSTFDPITDTIPDFDELNSFINSGSNVACYIDEKLAGFILYEDKNTQSYVRMVCVNSNYRGIGIGNKLMNAYFNLHDTTKTFSLWYDTNNDRAHNLYLRYGYKDEQIYSITLLV